jgi:hypothetical protein
VNIPFLKCLHEMYAVPNLIETNASVIGLIDDVSVFLRSDVVSRIQNDRCKRRLNIRGQTMNSYKTYCVTDSSGSSMHACISLMNASTILSPVSTLNKSVAT